MKERRLDGAKTSRKRGWFLRDADSGGNPVPTRQIRPSSKSNNSSSQYNPISVLRIPVKSADNDNFVRAAGCRWRRGLGPPCDDFHRCSRCCCFLHTQATEGREESASRVTCFLMRVVSLSSAEIGGRKRGRRGGGCCMRGSRWSSRRLQNDEDDTGVCVCVMLT